MKTKNIRVPNAQFEIIDKSGHLPNLENPTIFNQLIVHFYNGIKPAFSIVENILFKLQL